MKSLAKWFDLHSLKFRLSLGTALLSTLGLLGVASWMSWRMQQILIATHKQTILYINDRFPRDVSIYTDMYTLAEGAQKAIDNLTDPYTQIWVENNTKELIANSQNLDPNLVNLKNIPPLPEVKLVEGRYWVLCAQPLIIDGEQQGVVYIAQDITKDQIMFLKLRQNLSLATILGAAAMSTGIGFYVTNSLKPLQSLSDKAKQITPDQLQSNFLHLDQAPTEVQELASTLEMMITHLGEAWEDQRQLVSNVSHELRTPLTIVSGYLQSTLRRGNNLTPHQKDALAIAQAEITRTIGLMEDLLDLARADSGRMYFELQPMILNDLVIEIVEMARESYGRRINLNQPEQLIQIKADPIRFKQVLLNLIDNGLKYSPPDQEVTVNLFQESSEAKIQVSDKGIGIPLAHQTKIFERFYRVDEARSRHTGGTGLGLAIVKSFLDGMGGSISVRSQPEQGSTFTITFPLMN